VFSYAKHRPPTTALHTHGWWSGVVASTLASINEVNLRWARLILRWATVSGFNFRYRTIYFGMQPTSHPRPTQPCWPWVN